LKGLLEFRYNFPALLVSCDCLCDTQVLLCLIGEVSNYIQQSCLLQEFFLMLYVQLVSIV